MTHRHMKATIAAIALLMAIPALAANQVVNRKDGPWVLYKGTTRVATAPTADACVQLAVPLNPPRKTWSCKQTVTFETMAIPIPPTPVDAVCQDNGWQDTGAPSMCMNSQQTQAQTRTWTTVTPPSNGGKACPITEARTITKACTGPQPPMTGGPYIDPAKIPAPAVGYSTIRIHDSSGTADFYPDKVGAFRIPCDRSHFLPDDPIVYPGQPGASHLHMFFGNTSVKASTTPANIDTGNSTCPGGIAMRSSAWVPVMVDTVTHAPIEPYQTVIYYKSGYGGIAAQDIKPLPKNLRMIAGALPTNAAHVPGWEYNRYQHFWCDVPNHVDSETIPACPPGTELNMVIQFPQCWDGVNLDSANHRSHMAYPNGGCPATHPVAIPTVTFNLHFKVPPGGNTLTWRLSSDMYDEAIPAGYSLHADYWANWKDDVQAAWMRGCVNLAADCHGYDMNADATGDGIKDEVY